VKRMGMQGLRTRGTNHAKPGAGIIPARARWEVGCRFLAASYAVPQKRVWPVLRAVLGFNLETIEKTLIDFSEKFSVELTFSRRDRPKTGWKPDLRPYRSKTWFLYSL